MMAMSPLWDTSSEGIGPDTKPMDLATLGEHKAQCSKVSSRWLALHCGVGRTFGFVASRPVSACVLLAAALVLLLLWH